MPIEDGMELSQRRVEDRADRNGADELAGLRAVKPPPDLTGTALSTVAAVMVFPVLAAAVALVLHPLTFAPTFLVPVLTAPAVASIGVSRFRSQGAAVGAALAVASAASTVFYLCLFAAVLAVARLAGALVVG